MNDSSVVQLIMGVGVGVSLAAACGFRVFVPLLVVSLAVHFGGIHVNESFAWVGSWMAIVVLSTATTIEVLGYYIPLVDNLLDVLNTPLALVAGAMVTCGMLPNLHPSLKWGIAVAFGGVAGMVQSATSIIRGGSTATTGGLGNFLVSTGENICAVLIAVFAVVLPIIAIVLILIALTIAVKVVARSVAMVSKHQPDA